MNKNVKNRIDLIIQNLSVEFSNIPNFELTQTDSDANRVFNFVVNRFSDIHDFKTLYKVYYIPATNRSIVDSKREIQSSQYRKVLNVTDSQLKENYYDVIRLGYVGLFHKVENYTKELLSQANLLFNEGKTSNESIESFFEKRYKFKFNEWYSDPTLRKINWICNCVKHYDGYPKKEPKYPYLSHLPDDERIRISHHDFFKDVDYVADKYFHFKLTQVFSLSIFKIASDEMNDGNMSEDIQASYLNLESKIKQLMI